MEPLVLYAVTAVVFLGADAVALPRVIGPLFRRYLGDQLLETPRFDAAAVFYLAYVAGLVWLVSWPGYTDGAPARVLLEGAVVGLMAYGTYEFTNYATLRAWRPAMVMADLSWGTVLTGLSAWAGVWITGLIFG